MTAAEVVEVVQREKLYVSAGPVVGDGGVKRDEMFWVVTEFAQDSPRGWGSTLEEAYTDFRKKTGAEAAAEALM